MKQITLIILSLVFLQACNTYTPASKTNVSVAYTPEINKLHPEYYYYNSSSDSTTLILRQARKELTYDESLSARLSLSYTITSEYSSDKVIDSASIMIYDTLDGTKGNILKVSHRFELPAGNDFVLRTTLKDLNKDDYVWYYDLVEKETAYERNFFRIRSTNGELLINPLIHSQDSFRIEYKHAPHVFVRYINEEFAAPRPPYLNEKSQDEALKTDSVFRLQLNNGKSKVLSFKKPGIYHIQADTSQAAGYSLFFFREQYPMISEPGLMILATRYLATNREYKTLISSDNSKKAIDKFWLDITGNPERARILIREYYTRVEQANKLFYTHKPGWKTDRGMIYIIMGPPQVVYRSNNVETWIYGESEQYNALKLDFTKVNNPFTNNDYSLNRSPIYKDEWFFAIDVWRR